MVEAMRGVSGPVNRSSSRKASAGAAPDNRIRPIALIVAAAFGAASAAPSYANPEGAKVVSGSATISQHGSTLVIKNSPNAIINWQSFSIGTGETTDFIQQSVNSVVLNRVVGADPSVILGDLVSNGRVFLVNANGVVFGKGSMVDAAGLVVSTLDISNADFAAGTMRFVGSGTPGDIAVAGVLRSSDGDVYLIAPNITNSGSITAVNGEAILAAGQTVDILGSGLDNIKFEVQNTGNKAINLGQISGDAVGIFAGTLTQAGGVNANTAAVSGGHVILSALGAATLAPGSTTSADNAQGKAGSVLVEALGGDLTLASGAVASASGKDGGTVTLVADAGSALISGRIAATGSLGLGGTDEVLGQNVGLQSGAQVDASGSGGGGLAIIGGERGAAGLLAAQTTTIAAGASVNADATASGNGGTISTYGANLLTMDGALSAKGGVVAGNGGSVDTSGEAVSIGIGGTVTGAARSATGRPGSWVIDPASITVDNSAGATLPPSSDVSATMVASTLNGGTSVTIDTQVIGTTGVTGATISVNAPINVGTNASAVTLTLNAGGSININSAITNSGAPMTLNMTSNVDSIGGGISVSAPITLPGGTVNAQGGSFTQSAVITAGTFTATINSSGTGNFINTSTIDASGASNGGAFGGNVTVNAAGTIESGTILASGTNYDGGGSINLSGNDILLNGVLNVDAATGSSYYSAGSINLSSASIITNNAGGTLLSAVGGVGGGGGGYVDLQAADISLSAINIQAYGGSSTSGTPSGAGGQIFMNATDSISLTNTQLLAEGGSGFFGASAGGAGGQIALFAANSITLTNSPLFAAGGAGAGGLPGGAGGSVNLTAQDGTITIVGASTNVTGGAGSAIAGTGYYGGAGGVGGTASYQTVNGGSIMISSPYTIAADGGAGGASALGGNAGSVQITGGDVNLSGITISATGGSGGIGAFGLGTAQGPGGNGGNGGSISILGSSIELTTADLMTSGGPGGNAQYATAGNATYAGGNGGSGGAISLNTSAYDSPNAPITVISSMLKTTGGAGGVGSDYDTMVTDPTDNTTAGFGGAGGNAGSISVIGYGDVSFSGSNVYAIAGSGGNGGNLSGVGVVVAVAGDGGPGGSGGQIYINATAGTLTITGSSLASEGGNGGNGGQAALGLGGGGNGGAGGDSYDTNGDTSQAAITLSANGTITVDSASVIVSQGGNGGAGASANGTVQPNGTAYFLIAPGNGGNGGGAGGLYIASNSGDVNYSPTTTIAGGNGGAGGNLTGTNITNGSMIAAGSGGSGGSIVGLYGDSLEIYADGGGNIYAGGTMMLTGGNAGNGGSSSDQNAAAGAGGAGGSVQGVDIEASLTVSLGGTIDMIGGAGGYAGSGSVGNNGGYGGTLEPIALFQYESGGTVTLGTLDLEAGSGPYGINGTGEIDINAAGPVVQTGAISSTAGTFINVNASGSSVALTNPGNSFDQISGTASAGGFDIFSNNFLQVLNTTAAHEINISSAAGMNLSYSSLVAGTGGYGGIFLSGPQINFYSASLVSDSSNTGASSIVLQTDSLTVSGGTTFNASGPGDGIQITTLTNGRPIYVTADSYGTTGVYFPGLPELVIGAEFFSGAETNAIDIGNSSTSSITLASIANTAGTVVVPQGTQLGLTAGSISADGYTTLAVDAINVVSNSATLTRVSSSTPGGSVTLAGSALTIGAGAVLNFGVAAGVPLVVGDNTQGPYQNYGLEYYDHVVLAADNLHLLDGISMDSSPSSTLTLETTNPNTNINLGGSAYSGYTLTQSDLDHIFTEGTLTFGGPVQAGTLTVQGPVDFPNSDPQTVILDVPGGAISLAAGTLVSSAPLRLLAGTTITDSGGAVSAPSLFVLASDIGTSGAPVEVNVAGEITAQSLSDLYIASPSSIETTSMIASGSLNLSAPSIISSGTLTGDVVNLTGSLMLSGSVTASGDMSLQGGSVAIGSAGASAVVTAQNMTISASDLVIRGPDTTASPAGTLVNADGTLTVNAGSVLLEGGSAPGAYATLSSQGNSTYTVSGNVVLQGGSGNGSYALIDPEAAGSILNMSAHDINLTGGSGNNAYAAIVGYGQMIFNANSITFTTGSGVNSDAVVVSRTGSPMATTVVACPDCAPTVGANPINNTDINSGFFSATGVAPPPPPPPPAPAPINSSGIGEPLIDQIIGDLLNLIYAAEPPDDPLALPGAIYVDGGADGCI